MSTQRNRSVQGRAAAGRLATIITRDFYEGRLDLSDREMEAASWSQIPEVKCAEELFASRESPRTVRLFLTFIAALDHWRESEQLWHSGFRLFQSHPDFFKPRCASSTPVDRLRRVLSTTGVSRRQERDTRAWHQIARTLATEQRSAVYRVIAEGSGDAMELLADLRKKHRRGHDRFPFLRGPKIGPVWIRIMANPGQARINRLSLLPVGVDRQVRLVTENLGITSTQDIPLASAKCTIQTAWKDAVDAGDIAGPPGIRGTCAALDPVLWFFGKYGCSHCKKIGRREPISRGCRSCVWEAPR